MNGTELRIFIPFQILTWIAYSDLSRNLHIDWFWSLTLFTAKLWKSIKMIKFKCKDDLQVFFWLFLKELRSFSHFQILTKIAYPELAEILKIDWFWSFPSLTVKLWKLVKMIKFECKHDLQAFSWWMEQNFSSFSCCQILT